jgi:hypothetical protein
MEGDTHRAEALSALSVNAFITSMAKKGSPEGNFKLSQTRNCIESRWRLRSGTSVKNFQKSNPRDIHSFAYYHRVLWPPKHSGRLIIGRNYSNAQ